MKIREIRRQLKSMEILVNMVKFGDKWKFTPMAKTICFGDGKIDIIPKKFVDVPF